MTQHQPMTAEAVVLRQCIDDLIDKRLQERLEKLKDDEQGKRPKIERQHQREVWLENTAKQARKLQIATHVAKFSHPSTVATNIYFGQDQQFSEPMVSSAGERLTDDMAVRDAKALVTYTLLKEPVGGLTLLQRALRRDPDFISALSDDPATGAAWCEAFAGIAEDSSPPSSHELAKQIYFPLDEGNYHLLSPLYPTALAHDIYERVQVLYSDETKAARKARKAATAHAGYYELPNIAARKFGGNNKQNVSYLNSKRGGIGYLLASCPPNWDTRGLQAPVRVETIFGRWLTGFRSLRELTNGLARFLGKTRHNNLAIRQTRKRFVEQIVDEVLHLARTVQQLPAGWSATSECRLNPEESLWLDPGRRVNDEVFASMYNTEDWPDAIARRFANWLNHQIHSDRLPVGDAAAQQWHTDFSDAMADFEREVADER